MNISKAFKLVITIFVLSLLLSACGSGPTKSESVDEPTPETVVETTVEQIAEPTSEPTPVPEIEPEIVDLGNGIRLLLRGFPEDITLEANIDPEFKNNIPPSKNFDHLHTDAVIITFTQSGEYLSLDKGLVELCFTTTEPDTTLGDPKPYYWDTTKSPLVDGRGLRISEKKKEPEYMLCTIIQNSGAYAIVAW